MCRLRTGPDPRRRGAPRREPGDVLPARFAALRDRNCRKYLGGSLLSIWVNANWRITFRFIDSDVELVDYQDYH